MRDSLPGIIVVAGTSSNSGKTTLVCDLLAALPGSEAIKVTRGHYRSCGKQSDACCVGHLLGENAIVYSSPKETRVGGKDTDRFWLAGASNVHWVVAKAEQLEAGVSEAISRVRSRVVIIESTSALAFLKPQIAVLVVSPLAVVKASARRALRDGLIDTIYLASAESGNGVDFVLAHSTGIPVFDQSSLPQMLEMVAERAQITQQG